MIDAADIYAAGEALDGALGSRGKSEVGEWFQVRDIEELAVMAQAHRYACAGKESIPGQGLDLALISVFVLGFRLGVEVERERRDCEELPT